MIPTQHLAQYNIARAKADIDSDVMSDFRLSLGEINRLADSSPGFVWRLKTETGDATDIRPYADQRILITLSVWKSITDFRHFTYHTGHIDFLRRRAEWFEHLEGHNIALWWVSQGTIPTVADAVARLLLLRSKGPSPQAFDLHHIFECE